MNDNKQESTDKQARLEISQKLVDHPTTRKTDELIRNHKKQLAWMRLQFINKERE